MPSLNSDIHFLIFGTTTAKSLQQEPARQRGPPVPGPEEGVGGGDGGLLEEGRKQTSLLAALVTMHP